MTSITAYASDSYIACARYSALGGKLDDRHIYCRKHLSRHHFPKWPGKVSEDFPTPDALFLVTNKSYEKQQEERA